MQSLVARQRTVVRTLAAVIPRGTGASSLRNQELLEQQQHLQQRRSFYAKDKSKSVYEYGAHRSDAEELIAKVPIVMVDGPIALCDGGGGALGHPLEYIQLHNAKNEPVTCRYCGIQYQMKQH